MEACSPSTREAEAALLDIVRPGLCNGFQICVVYIVGLQLKLQMREGLSTKGERKKGKEERGKEGKEEEGGSVSFGLELIKVLFCFLKTLHTVTHFSCDNSSDTISFYNFDLHFSDY